MKSYLISFSTCLWSPQSSENIPPGYEVVSLLEALNGPLTPSPAVPPLHVLGDRHLSGMLPSYGSDGHLPPVRTFSPLDRLSDCGSQGLKLKKSLSKWVGGKQQHWPWGPWRNAFGPSFHSSVLAPDLGPRGGIDPLGCCQSCSFHWRPGLTTPEGELSHPLGEENKMVHGSLGGSRWIKLNVFCFGRRV